MEPIGRSDFSFRINFPRTKLALDREILWNVRSAKAIKIGTPIDIFSFWKVGSGWQLERIYYRKFLFWRKCDLWLIVIKNNNWWFRLRLRSAVAIISLSCTIIIIIIFISYHQFSFLQWWKFLLLLSMISKILRFII